MKLIDKDALMEELLAIQSATYMSTCISKDECIGKRWMIARAIDAVKDAQEVNAVPVVRGEWVVTDAYPHRVYCSLCYKTNVPNEEWLYEKNDYPKYCMWCGAKMARSSGRERR